MRRMPITEEPLGAATVVAVLAGGRGSRLSQPKAAALAAGRPLISYPLQAARDAGLEAFVVAKQTTWLPPLTQEVVLEPGEPHHPLCGLITALQHAPRVIAVGCDMPFLTGPLLAFLAAQPRRAAFELEGLLQPLPSLHDQAELPALRQSLAAQESLRAAFSRVEITPLAGSALHAFGRPDLLLRSVNTAEQLGQASIELADRAGRVDQASIELADPAGRGQQRVDRPAAAPGDETRERGGRAL